jgi:aspartate kinase
MITTSEVAVSVTIDSTVHLKDIMKELEPFGTVEIEENHTIVSIVGNQIAETKDVLGKLFEALSPVPVRMVSYGGSKHNVSLLVPSAFKVQTLQLLNRGLFGLG